MILHILVIAVGVLLGGFFRLVHDPVGSAPLVQWLLFATCYALTFALHVCRMVLSAFPKSSGLRQELPNRPRFLSLGADGQLLGLDSLPRVPPLVDIQTVCFGGCGSLCMYNAGAAYALQQAPNFDGNFRRGRLIVRGSSNGSLIAAAFATGCNMAEFFRIAHSEFGKYWRHACGCFGRQSAIIENILRTSFSEARVPFVNAKVELNVGDLEISVARFSPWPEHALVKGFMHEKTLINTVLGACYIPAVYEAPIRLPKLGMCMDAAAVKHVPTAQIVISPLHCHNADVTPVQEYPHDANANLLHGDDLLRLFEDGYLDAVRWLESGGESKLFERQEAMCEAPTASHKDVKGIVAAVWSLIVPLKKSKAD